MLKRLVARLLLLLTLGALAACDSLPTDVEQEASRIDRGITELGETLTSRRGEYAAMQADAEEWAFFQPYAEREDWEATFTAVEAELADLRRRYDREIAPIVEEDKSEDAERLRGLLEGIASNFDPTRDQMNAVNARMQLLREGYENAPTWIADARAFVTQIEASVASVQGDRERAQADFPSRATDIDERFAPLNLLLTQARDALAVAEAEFAKHEAGENADYAAFADSYTTTRENAAAAVLEAEDYQDQLASLYEEYTTVLRDMKVEYRVVIGRSSWDDCCDGSRYERDATYPEQDISPADYEYLNSLSQGEREGAQGYLAHYSVGGLFGSGGVQSHINSDVWRRLNLNATASWPDGHDQAMFWIEDLYPVYFHRYAEINGTTVVEGEWEEVDEPEFGLYADAFGMAIEQKARGQFADEAIAEPAPAGIDMVGDDHYGEWRTDSSGNSFWHWYGQYAFFSTLFGPDPYYYSRNDYNSYRSWRDDRRTRTTYTAANYGWYGSNRSSPTFGSGGSVTAQSASYRNSPFASSGGTQRISQTVRNAGSEARSRGPGSAGK